MARAVTHQMDELHAMSLSQMQDAVSVARCRLRAGHDAAVIVAETAFNIDVGSGRAVPRTVLAALLATSIVELAQSERMHDEA